MKGKDERESSVSSEAEQSNTALHRIAARWRFLLNLKGRIWAARGELERWVKAVINPGRPSSPT